MPSRRIGRRPCGRISALCTISWFIADPLAAQQSRAVVRVVDSTGRAIASARLSGARPADRVEVWADERDRAFRVGWSGSDSVDVRVTAIGFAPSVLRIGVGSRRVTLRSRFASLGAVRVTGGLTGPPRPVDGSTPDAGGSTTPLFFGALSLDQEGAVGASAAAAPYVYGGSASHAEPSGPSSLLGGAAGFSVLGLPTTRSIVLLDGMRLPLGALPRDAQLVSQVTTASYDVARAGFSGGALVLNTMPAQRPLQRTLRLSIEDRRFRWDDPVSARITPRMRTMRFSTLASGASEGGGVSGSIAAQVDRQEQASTTWLSAQQELATVRRVSAADQAGLVNAGTAAGLAFGSPLAVGSSVTASVLMRGDLQGSGSRRLRAVVAGARSVDSMLPPWAGNFSTATVERQVNSFVAQLRGSVRVPTSVLHEAWIGTTRSDGAIAPRNRTVTATVAMPSHLSGTLRPVAVGAAGAGPARQSDWSVDASYALTGRPANGRHELRGGVHLRLDEARLSDSSGLTPALFFPSVAALSAGTPSALTRRTSATSGAIRVSAVDAFVGETWAPRSNLRVQVGARLESERWLQPSRDAVAIGLAEQQPVIGSARTLSLSPRVGVEWRWRNAAEPGTVMPVPSGVVIRGGVGHFRQTPTASALLSDGSFTTLGSQVTCTGGLELGASWAERTDHLSMQCPASAVALVTPSPSALRSRNFRSPVSWRSGASVDFPLPWSLRGGLEWIGSWSGREPSVVDANFSGRNPIALPLEGSRPVWFPPEIVQRSAGLVPTASTRLESTLGSVYVLESRARSSTQQLAVGVGAARPTSLMSWSLFYVWRNTVDRVNGFSGTTISDPREWERVRSALDVRHQVGAQFSARVGRLAYLSSYVRAFSGRPFTPIVAQDINGDGLVNDRAFIPDGIAAHSEEPLANAIATALPSVDARSRRCLESQMGRLARANSCESPWTSTAAVSLTVNPAALRLPDRATVTIGLINVPSALDRAINGSRMRGWGDSRPIDQRLLFVRGFDATRRAFEYSVNPAFGVAAPGVAAMRAPFRLMLDVRVALGPRLSATVSERLSSAARSERELFDSVRFVSVVRASVTNVPRMLMQQRQAVEPTAAQDSMLRAEAATLDAQMDLVWGALAADARYRERRGRGALATRLFEAAQDRAVDLVIASAARIRRDVLTANQVSRLPADLQAFLSPSAGRALRPITSPGLGAALFPRERR